MSRYMLKVGESLKPDESLEHGKYKLTMQSNGNLVLKANDQVLWASDTYGKGCGCHLDMQSDGNLVIKDSCNKAVWSTNTCKGNGWYIMTLQHDGNLLVWGPPLWGTSTASKTHQPLCV